MRKFRDLLTMDVGIFALRQLANQLEGSPFRLAYLEGKGGYTVFAASDRNGIARYIIKVANSFKGNITKRVISEKRTQYVYLEPSGRFERERLALNILSVHGLGPRPVLSHEQYSVEEYISGAKFSEMFVRGGRDAGEILRKVLAAVARMHWLGVTHGDLRPYNILVEGDRVRFIDFEHMLDPKKFTGPQMRAFDYLILLDELTRIDAKGLLKENAGGIRAGISARMPVDFTKEDVDKVMEDFSYARELSGYFF